MAYFRENIVETIVLPPENYDELKRYKSKEITLEHTWKSWSRLRDSNGAYLDAQVVPELKEIYVPRILFETIGVYAWFNHSFPNCSILFWEDDLA
jgi:hypothetical protein